MNDYEENKSAAFMHFENKISGNRIVFSQQSTLKEALTSSHLSRMIKYMQQAYVIIKHDMRKNDNISDEEMEDIVKIVVESVDYWQETAKELSIEQFTSAILTPRITCLSLAKENEAKGIYECLFKCIEMNVNGVESIPNIKLKITPFATYVESKQKLNTFNDLEEALTFIFNEEYTNEVN